MTFGGVFNIEHNGHKFMAKNRLTFQGATSFLKQIFQADVTDVTAGGNWFVGLCGENAVSNVDFPNIDLTDITDEPSSAGGYARKAIARNTTGFPTASITVVGQSVRSRSLQITWTPSGADFSLAITRLFLCNVVSGTSGILYAFSGPLLFSDGSIAPQTLLDGVAFNTNYDFYIGE